MKFETINTGLRLIVMIGCGSLLSACGGSDDKKEPVYNAPTPPASSVSSISPSSEAASSIPASSSAPSSLAASSIAALSAPPVAWVDTATNPDDGNYLVAKGDIALALPEDASNTSFKEQWTNREGFALYTFAKDGKGVSNCSATCLANWPPLLAGANDTASSPYSIIERSLGNGVSARQWAYQGLPLYFFKSDTVAAQTNGKAIANWQLARPIPIAVKAHASKGDYLIGKGPLVNGQGLADQSKAGFTLYTFAKDTSNQSNCGASCIANWPPVYAAAEAQNAGDFSVITRSDNIKQWAYNGQPLYFYAGDSAAGDINGEITNWSLATVNSQLASSSAASSSSTDSSASVSSSSSSSSSYNYGY